MICDICKAEIKGKVKSRYCPKCSSEIKKCYQYYIGTAWKRAVEFVRGAHESDLREKQKSDKK